jgi:hypothetical protein
MTGAALAAVAGDDHDHGRRPRPQSKPRQYSIDKNMNTTYLGQAGSQIDAYAENVIWEESTYSSKAGHRCSVHNFYPDDDWELINRREVYELKNQKRHLMGMYITAY